MQFTRESCPGTRLKIWAIQIFLFPLIYLSQILNSCFSFPALSHLVSPSESFSWAVAVLNIASSHTLFPRIYLLYTTARLISLCLFYKNNCSGSPLSSKERADLVSAINLSSCYSPHIIYRIVKLNLISSWCPCSCCSLHLVMPCLSPIVKHGHSFLISGATVSMKSLRLPTARSNPFLNSPSTCSAFSVPNSAVTLSFFVLPYLS